MKELENLGYLCCDFDSGVTMLDLRDGKRDMIYFRSDMFEKYAFGLLLIWMFERFLNSGSLNTLGTT